VIAIVVNASGCGVQVREYAHLLARDPAYAKKAERIAAMAKELTVTTRTIRRDLEAVQQVGFPVRDEERDGKKYWRLEGAPFRALERSGFTLSEASVAETTATIWLPLRYCSTTRRATFLMREASPTDVPPNFCTINILSTPYNTSNALAPTGLGARIRERALTPLSRKVSFITSAINS
jgi:hypothetical protein